MGVIHEIMNKAGEYGLNAKLINDYTIALTNKVIRLDEWLVIFDEDDNQFIIKHMNKSKKVTHHTQSVVAAYNWEWVLERIVQHDEYIINTRGTYSSLYDAI